MTGLLAIARRDFLALILTPTGPIIAALFLFLAGVSFYWITFGQGEPANLRPVFEFAGWGLLAIAPAISMRAFTEEIRGGTLETLLTSPLRDTHIVVGKFLAGIAFLAAMLLPTLAFVALIEWFGRPDYGELACGYLGLMLMGSAYVASGIFASTLSASQAIAYLLTLFFWVSISIAVAFFTRILPPQWADILFALDHARRLREFTIGLIDTANVTYFLAITIAFLSASALSLAVRRSR